MPAWQHGSVQLGVVVCDFSSLGVDSTVRLFAQLLHRADCGGGIRLAGDAVCSHCSRAVLQRCSVGPP
jgi:hypothetical protein